MGGMLADSRKLTDFPGGQKHGGEMYWRLNRAHANLCENLPIFGAVIVSGYLLNCISPQFAQLCQVIVIARVCQSSVHILSGSSPAIFIRFMFFGVQMMSITYLGFYI